MLHSKSNLFLFFSVSLFLACSKSPDQDGKGPDSTVAEESHSLHAQRYSSTSDTASYAIDFKLAKDMVTSYVEFGNRNYNENPYAKAFLIRSSSLKEVMLMGEGGQAKVDYIRAYIGLDSTGEFRLFLVPVKDVGPGDVAGVDSLMSGPYTNGPNLPGDSVSNGNFVWDFTRACPLDCPRPGSNSIYVD